MVSFRRKKKDDAPATKKDEPKAAVQKKAEEKPAPKAAAAPTKPPTLDDIPELIEQMLNSKGEKSAAATKRIYELCDVGHKQNRVFMVCSGKYDVLTPLAKCLTQESGDGRHLACLALNNLSIPTENKRVMALGPASKDVIGGLCKVIAKTNRNHTCAASA
jgi:3-oxoacyl-ACP reductase-like protein